jgi:hypothetical protein
MKRFPHPSAQLALHPPMLVIFGNGSVQLTFLCCSLEVALGTVIVCFIPQNSYVET